MNLLDVVRSDATLLERKQNDYSTADDPWLNFREAAEFVSKTRSVNFSHVDAAYFLLGLKMSRLKNLGKRDPANESKHDTLQDLRGYSAIIQTMEQEEAMENASDSCISDDSPIGLAGMLVVDDVGAKPGRAPSLGSDLNEDNSRFEYMDDGTINGFARTINEMAYEKGWWNWGQSPNVGIDNDIKVIAEKLLMVHSEISEATEELRTCKSWEDLGSVAYEGYENPSKPIGFAVELADAVIRLLDLMYALGIDIETVMRDKIRYNATRPHRHGDKNL